MPFQKHRQGAGPRRQEIARLLNDQRSGSSFIAERALRLLIDEAGARRGRASLAQVCRWAVALRDAHSTMALLHHLSAAIEASVRRTTNLPADASCAELAQDLGRWRTALVDAQAKLSALAAGRVPSRRPLLLLSHSGAVLKTCAMLAGRRHLRVVVCESRPLCEGVTMAGALASMGCGVTVITDAACGNWISRCGAVLLGADWVDRRGFVNKTGSRVLSVLADAAGLPVFVLADHLRIQNRLLSAERIPLRDPRQVVTSRKRGLNVDNRHFERVEWMPPHRLITDHGCFDHPSGQWSEIAPFRK